MLGSVAALSIAAAPALAAVNLKSAPSVSFSGASATVSGGNFSGLGNIPVTGQLSVTGLANYACHNNGNPENVVPGQNPVQAQGGLSDPIALDTSKNGRATVPSITVFITAPPTPSAQSVGCGGKGAVNNWTVALTSLEATNATFVVREGGVRLFEWAYVKGGSATGTLVFP
ncbi:hypothetical protein [Ornithinimicrobium cerasi]|uniref:hypothetical protein n=1 Tax=Ornithinimicrobium cerasi TaxID=2248773 RepID=UPI001143BE13|nr:hypothetical protein [Ornithinimicrobium cerasi]